MEALRAVSVEFGTGECTAIIGQNGSGKTTLAKHLNGLLRPTHGAVLAMEPEALVLDEPTAGQDARGLARLRELVAVLAQSGRTVVVIAHDMEFCAEACQRIIVMGRGQLLADGDKHRVFAQREVLAQTFVEPPQITRLGAALGLAETVTTVPEFIGALQA